MKTCLAIVVAAAVLLSVPGCKSSEKPAECKGCEAAKGTNSWCDSCKVGWKDGEKMKCPSCHTAATGKGGWCDGCSKGYANGKATMCKGCATAAATGGTCPT